VGERFHCRLCRGGSSVFSPCSLDGLIASCEWRVDATFGQGIRMNRTDFLSLVRRESLAQWPNLDTLHAAGIADAARLLHSLRGPIILDHPRVPGLRMILDASVGAKIFHLLRIGEYEAGDFELYGAHLAPGDRVLELGGGVGLTAACCALITMREVIVVEPNPRLHDLIGRQAVLNKVNIHVDPRCATAQRASAPVPFYIHGELWRSSLLPDRGEQYETILVETVEVGSLLDATRPDALIVDIEGAERDLFLGSAHHLPPKLFIEIHVPRIGEEASAHVVERIVDRGYTMIDHRDWMFFFTRANVSA
jgi:FkbM family methyltransferase